MQPFEGVRVLDFCWVGIGPMTTRYLADHGATVVRVESEHRVEQLRRGGPFKDNTPGVNRSGYFANYNANKFGITLNMSHPKGVEIARRLVAWADIVAENFTPGTMEKWGLGYNDLVKLNPSVIMFSASMLGRDGPYSSQPGFGPVMSALAGFSHLSGWPDRAPVTPYGAYPDFFLPHFAVATIVAALDYRRRTGKGQHLDMSQLEGSLHLLAPVLLDYAANGHIQGRQGNADPSVAPHNAYPCRGPDRWCAIACPTDAHWQAICREMVRPELARDPRFATLQARKANEPALDDIIGQWTRQHDPWELMERLQRAGVPAGVVETSEDLFHDPQLKERGHFVFLDHPEIGRHACDTSPFLMSASPPQYRMPAPLLGQHTHQVLQEMLGMSEEEIRTLEKEGALE